MYICIGCGGRFVQPFVVEDGHGFELPPFEVFQLCPYCGSSNIETETSGEVV